MKQKRCRNIIGEIVTRNELSFQVVVTLRYPLHRAEKH